MTDAPNTPEAQEIAPEAQEQVRNALDTALNKPQQAQGFLSNIPDLSSVGPKVAGVLDDVIGAVEQILQYKWLIPDKYEGPLEKLLEALNKVKGWVS